MHEPAPPAFDDLLRQRRWLRRIAASLVVDAASADDLAQQTLLTALERPPADRTAPRAWLATVVRNLARKLATGERRRSAREQAAAAPECLAATDEVVARAALQTEVATAVLALAEPCRTALLLRFFDDLPPRAIAKRTGAPVETVRTRIKRGLELLRAELVRRRGAAGPSGSASSTWAVALIGLLDAGMRRAVKRAVLAKATGAGASVGAGAGVVGASTLAGVLGVLGMTTKLKLAVATLVLAGGTFAVVKLCESPKLPPRDSVANATRGAPGLAAPVIVDAKELAKPAEATRAAEPRDSAKEKVATTASEKPAGVVEGIVRTSRGEPAAGAVVLLEDATRHGEFATLEELSANAVGLLHDPLKPHDLKQRNVTEADGSFRFTELVPGGSVDVAAIHLEEGTALQAGVVVVRGETPTRVELTLVAGVVLHGTVTDRQGVAIEGATVNVNRCEHTTDGSTSSSSLLTLKCDGDGRYRTIPLPFRGFEIGATAQGFLNESGQEVVVAENERDHRTDFKLGKAVTLRGRIVLADGTPAHLAQKPGDFIVGASDRDPRREAMSVDALDDHGKLQREADRYEITPWRAGMHFISIWAGDTLIGAAEIADSGNGAGIGPDVVVDLAKAPPPTPKGILAIEVVSGGDDAPVNQFHAEVLPDPTTARDPRVIFEKHEGDATTGRLEIADLRVGNYDVTVHAKGLVGRSVVAKVTVPTSVTRVELRPATGFVSGRVQDENGRPISGANVHLLGSDGRVAAAYPECTTKSNTEGEFVFKGIAEGDGLLVAESEGFAPDAVAAVALAKGDATRADALLTLRTGVELTIQPHGVGIATTGPFMYRIKDERGATVVDHHRYPGTLTSSNGGGMVFRLAPGLYNVEVFCPKFITGTAKFTAVAGKVVDVDLVPQKDEGGGR